MRRALMRAALLLMFAALAGCPGSASELADRKPNGPFYGAMTLVGYATLEEMARESDLIILAERIGQGPEKVHEHLDYTVTEVRVARVLKGNPALVGRTVNIVEFSFMSMSRYDKVNRYVLFLHPHNGRIAENGWWIRGVYQGKFKLDRRGRLFYDAHKYGGIKSFQDELKGLTVPELEELLKRAR